MIKKILSLDNTDYTVRGEILNTIVTDLKNNFFRDPDLHEYRLDNYRDSNFESTMNIEDNTNPASYMEISTDTESDESLMYANNITLPDVKPIIMDANVGLIMSPITLFTTYRYTIKYFHKSKTEINKILNLLKYSVIKDINRRSHDVYYYYLLPITALGIINNIWTLLSNGMTAKEYLESIVQVPLDYRNSRNGTHQEPIIREKQMSVIGVIDDAIYNAKINKETDNPGWSIEFTYRIDLQPPTGLLIHYPILVNNNKIDSIYLPPEVRVSVGARPSLSSDAETKTVESTYQRTRTYDPLIRIPSYDLFTPTFPNPGMFRLLSVLLQVDTEQPDYVLNLEDFVALNMNTEIVNYLKQEAGTKLFNAGFSLFHFEIYENNAVRDLEMTLSDTFDIRTNSEKPLDPMKIYHLVLSVMTDLRLLVNYDEEIASGAINTMIDIIKYLNLNHLLNDVYVMRTVMRSYIIPVIFK